MSTQAETNAQVRSGIITQEQATELVEEALDSDLSEPESFVRLLVVLYDHAEGYLQEAIYRMIRGAYSYSLAQSFSLQSYMAALRAGRDPLKEARSTVEQEERKAAREATSRSKKKRKQVKA